MEDDALLRQDRVFTKKSVRAVSLAALAPRVALATAAEALGVG